MTKKTVVTVVARGDELVHGGGPAAFKYASQLFDEAGLEDAAGVTRSDFWRRLRILNRAIKREFGDRVMLRMINLWSLQGLWFCTRHHVREFPCIVIAEQHVPLDTPQEQMLEMVRLVLDRE